MLKELISDNQKAQEEAKNAEAPKAEEVKPEENKDGGEAK